MARCRPRRTGHKYRRYPRQYPQAYCCTTGRRALAGCSPAQRLSSLHHAKRNWCNSSAPNLTILPHPEDYYPNTIHRHPLKERKTTSSARSTPNTSITPMLCFRFRGHLHETIAIPDRPRHHADPAHSVTFLMPAARKITLECAESGESQTIRRAGATAPAYTCMIGRAGPWRLQATGPIPALGTNSTGSENDKAQFPATKPGFSTCPVVETGFS